MVASGESQSRIHTRKKPWLGLLVTVTSLFTVVCLQYSIRHGRLLFPPYFDDIGYFVDAAQRLKILQEQGFVAFWSNYVNSVPHSPFASLLALMAFMVLGWHEWAPYAATGLLVFAFLLFVDRLVCQLPTPQRALVLAYVLTVPFLANVVTEFRPDIPWGISVAVGTSWPLLRGETFRPRIDSGLMGAFFGLALLIKPSTAPLTVLLLGCAAMWFLLPAWSRREQPFFELPRPTLALLMIAVSAVVAAPHYSLAFGHVAQYTSRVLGPESDIWSLTGGVLDHAVYYVTGPGGRVTLGIHAWIAGTVTCMALAWALARGRWRILIEHAPLALGVLVAYLVPTILTVKNRHLGAAFATLVVVVAVLVLRNCLLLGGDTVAGRRWGSLSLALLVLVALVRYESPIHLGSPGAGAAVHRQRIFSEIYESIKSRITLGNERVLVTATGRAVNSAALAFNSIREGMTLNFSDASKVATMNEFWQVFAEEEFVVAFEPGFAWINVTLPSTRIQGAILSALRSRSDYCVGAVVPGPNGKRAFLLEKVRPFFGLNPLAGFGRVLAGDQNVDLPTRRQGLTPATYATIDGDRSGAGVLVLRAAPGEGIDTVSVIVAGERVGELSFSNPERFEEARFPLELPSRGTVVTLRYLPASSPAAGGVGAFFSHMQWISNRECQAARSLTGGRADISSDTNRRSYSGVAAADIATGTSRR